MGFVNADKPVLFKDILIFFHRLGYNMFFLLVDKKIGVTPVGFTTDDVIYLKQVYFFTGPQNDGFVFRGL